MKLVIFIFALIAAVIAAANGQTFYRSLMPQYPSYLGKVFYPYEFHHPMNVNPYYFMPMPTIGEKHALIHKK